MSSVNHLDKGGAPNSVAEVVDAVSSNSAHGQKDEVDDLGSRNATGDLTNESVGVV